VTVRGHQHYTAKPPVQMVRGKLVLKQNGIMEGPVMEHMAKNVKGRAVSCGQWSSLCLSDVPEVRQIYKDGTAVMHNTGLPRFITMAQHVTPCVCKCLIRTQTPEVQGLKTCTYDQHMQKNPPKNIV